MESYKTSFQICIFGVSLQYANRREYEFGIITTAKQICTISGGIFIAIRIMNETEKCVKFLLYMLKIAHILIKTIKG